MKQSLNDLVCKLQVQLDDESTQDIEQSFSKLNIACVPKEYDVVLYGLRDTLSEWLHSRYDDADLAVEQIQPTRVFVKRPPKSAYKLDCELALDTAFNDIQSLEAVSLLDTYNMQIIVHGIAFEIASVTLYSRNKESLEAWCNSYYIPTERIGKL
jgi:hypothetical protein